MAMGFAPAGVRTKVERVKRPPRAPMRLIHRRRTRQVARFAGARDKVDAEWPEVRIEFGKVQKACFAPRPWLFPGQSTRRARPLCAQPRHRRLFRLRRSRTAVADRSSRHSWLFPTRRRSRPPRPVATVPRQPRTWLALASW